LQGLSCATTLGAGFHASALTRGWERISEIVCRKLIPIRVILLASALSLLMITTLAMPAWASQQPTAPQERTLVQEEHSPESNLGYLFAVYTITWIVFFAYLFFISRRQRDMRREMEALKRALEEKGVVDITKEEP